MIRTAPIVGALALAASFVLAGGGGAQAEPLHRLYEGQAYHGGRYVQTTWSNFGGNHPLPWTYPSTYPWTNPVTYQAGPGNYYPAKAARMHQARHGQRWTGHPPRHLFIVDYNGYAPPYYKYPQ